jgi:hypothetical protein
MAEEVKAALIGVTIGSLFTGGLSWLISKHSIKAAHQNAIELLHRQEFIKAAINFRSAFFDLLIFCQQPPSGSGAEPHLVDFIIKSIEEHTKAALLFRAYLPSINRFSFDEAWKEYSRQDNWNQFTSDPIKTEYGTVFYDISEETKKCHLVASRIDKLFQFAPLEIERK